MVDVLDLMPDSQELEQFHREVIRPEQPVFNPLGQYCIVKRCSSMVKYHNLRDLITHWQHVHQQKRELYKCKSCRRVFPTRSKCKKHLRDSHKIREQEERSIISVYVDNKEFIPPRDAILPRIGSPEENADIIQKEKEWAQRVRHMRATASSASKLAEREEAEDILREFN